MWALGLLSLGKFITAETSSTSTKLRAKTSLGQRLLWLTILFVMLAQIAIFLPSAAAFHTQWLQDRVQAARLVVLGVEIAENMMVSEDVALQMLETAMIKAVRINREGSSEIILPTPLALGDNVLVDLRKRSFIRSLIEICDSLLLQQPQFLRVQANFGTGEADFIEVMVLEADLREELFTFSIRSFWMSLMISVLSGALIYTSLLYLLVRPMRNLSLAMTRFRDAPEDPTKIIVPSTRTDEIGLAETDLAQLQTQVLQSLSQKSRLAALGEAVAKINHDMRNILTSVQLVSDRLATDNDPAIRKMGERLVRAIGRGVNLSRITLEYGRSSEPEPEAQSVSLFLALEDAWLDACIGPKCAVQWSNKVDPDLSIRVDPDHLYRILVNLLRNATHAMHDKGRLQADIISTNGTADLRISDDGPGIVDHICQNLFSPFSGTSRKDGSGLGLAIARELARANGGDLDLETTSKTGTSFVVKLVLS